MGWKDWPYWLKGVILSVIINSIALAISYFPLSGFGILVNFPFYIILHFLGLSENCNFVCSTMWAIKVGIMGWIFLEVYAILLGALIGWWIGRRKEQRFNEPKNSLENKIKIPSWTYCLIGGIIGAVLIQIIYPGPVLLIPLGFLIGAIIGWIIGKIKQKK